MSTASKRELLVKIGSNKLLARSSCSKLSKAKEEFRRQNWIKLCDLVERDLLNKILEKLQQDEFHEFVHDYVGSNRELRLNRGLADRALELLFNSREFFSVIEEITECGHIGSFIARVYRFEPHSQNFDQWHDDDSEDRLLTLTLNLSEFPYEGGNLEMREKISPANTQEICNKILGDAILFRIGPHLEHRVTGVVGDRAKTAYAGWFCSKPEFGERFHR